MRVPTVACLALAAGFVLAAPAAAQDAGLVSPAEIEAALERHQESVEADRSAVARILDSEAAGRAALALGVDLDRARDGARLLEGEELARAGSLAREAEDQLAGGQAITISTTAIIIVLLLVILVVILAD